MLVLYMAVLADLLGILVFRFLGVMVVVYLVEESGAAAVKNEARPLKKNAKVIYTFKFVGAAHSIHYGRLNTAPTDGGRALVF